MKHTNISLESLFNQGSQIRQQEHREKDRKSAGILRVGNSGALVGHDVLGECHRVTFARWMGREDNTVDIIREGIFDMGRANEVVWYDKLKRSWPGTILREEEIPVRWFTATNDVPVSGRPDMVLCEGVGAEIKPVLVVEHKVAVSSGKACDRFLGKIETKDFLQACHYSWKLGVPGILVYSYYGIAPVSWFVPKDQRPRFWPKGKSWEVRPFRKEFKIGLNEHGKFYYIVDGEITTTAIGPESIENYYELVTDMKASKNLYRRHSALDLDGSAMKYDPCDYCPLQDTCDSYEHDYDRWVDEVLK